MENVGSMKKLLLLCLYTLLVTSCGSDEPDLPPAEEIVVTNLRYELARPTLDPLVFTYEDANGTGVNDPIITAPTIGLNTVYFGSFFLMDQTKNPPDNISAEIEDNKEDYQFFFNVIGVDMEVVYADTDANGNPVGLNTAVRPISPGTGSLLITLVEGLNKFGEDVNEGNIWNAGGTTIVQVTLPIIIE